MTSLNEHEQQLLQTLLSHADAVAPSSDKPPQPGEHSSSLDFNNSDNDLHFWDNLINDEAEAMQFEQQSSTTPFGHSGSQQLQHAPDSGPSGASGSSFQAQTSPEFKNQQPGFTAVATGQTSLGGFQDQGQGFQQVQHNQAQSPQMNVNSPDSYQNQSSSFQQQFPVGGAMDQNGQPEKSGSLACGFSNQSPGFSQQYSMDTAASGAQSEVGGHVGGPFPTQVSSYQPQTHAQFSDSSRHLQAQQQQQTGQTGGSYLSNLPNSGKDQVSHSSVVYQNQTSDTPQQQSFLTKFGANGGANTSLEALVQVAGFQQQYTSNNQTQATQERRDSSQQHPIENFASQVANFQQQQQPPGQQQNMFQQGTQMNSDNTTEQTYHSSPADGSSLCFTEGLSGFSPQTAQQEQQGAIAASAGVKSPESLQAVVGEGVQHMQFQNSTPSKGQTNQEGTEAFQSPVPHFAKQKSFHSPGGSPAQPVASPLSYPQPSADPHSTYSQPTPTAGQGDHTVTVGLGFTGQTCGFPKQQSFPSPAPSPDKGAGEGAVPSSPASNYQHQSPGFSIQSPYSASGQPQNQGDQTPGGCYTPHTPVFSQALPVQGDQNVVTNFQGNSVYSNNAVQDNPPSAGSFQTQDNLHSHCSVQSDSGVHSQSNAFQQSVFQSSALPASQSNVTAQPMQEGSGPSSIEAEAVAFLVQESLKSVNQQSQSLDLESNNSAVPYQQIPASQSAINTHRDQPMETQQSPYVVGSASNTGTFQSAAPAQPSVYQETVTQGSQVGASFLNQTLPFQAQSNTFQASSSMSAQTLPLSMTGLMSGGAQQNQNPEFANNSMASSSFPCPDSGGFSNQTVNSSGQSGSMSYTQTTFSETGKHSTPSIKEGSQFSQHSSSSSTFNQFAVDATSSFGHSNVQMQVQQTQRQQFAQPVNQQQTMQQTAFSSQPAHNASAHNLPAVVNESVPIHHGHAVTGFGNQQFEMGQFQGQQVLASAEPQQGTHNLPNVVASLQSSSVPNQLFAQSMPAPVPNSAGCPVSQSSSNTEKSAAASLQDSNQTNSALLMLSSVLQQIQSILPKALGQQKESGPTLMQSEIPDRSDNPEVLNQLLQSKDSASKILQLLQQERNAPSHTTDTASKQTPSQAFPFDQQEKQQSTVSMTQQPNFLVQPSNQQHVFIAPQQQQQPTQQQSKETIPKPGQQMAEQIPSSMVSSLAGSLGTHGITIGSDGQLMIGNHSVKLLLDSSSSHVNLVPVSAAGTSAAPVSVPSMASSQSAGVGELPLSLQHAPANMFSASAASSIGSMTHNISTTPTAVPHVGSNISKSTTVIPTSSFTQPLSVAGVGMGLAVTSSSSTSAPAEPSAYPVPSSKLLPAASVQSAGLGATNTVNTPPIANIFYPISSASRSEKKMETSGNNVSASVPVGNFLNVTTGSASMLLNAFSMAVADGKQDSSGFKAGGFSLPEVSTGDNAFGEFVQPNREVDQNDTADMEIVEVIESSSSTAKPMETDKPLTNLTPRHTLRKTSIEEELESKEDNVPGSVLRRILTMKDEDGNAPNSKGGSPTPGSSPAPTPTELFVDGNTQATLIERSEKLRLSSEAQQDDEMPPTDFWTSVPSFVSAAVEDYVPSKVHRGADDLDATSKHVSLPSVEKLFDAGGATSNSAFVFTKFGSEDAGVRTFSGAGSEPISSASTSGVGEDRVTGIVSSVKSADLLKLGHVPTASIRPNSRRQKEPLLTFQFPSKVGEYELRILAQPEEQHRARYLTEGSRGAVKDKSQQGYPHVKLVGYNEPAILQVFIGSESGRVKPHGFYQACKVCGKNSTPCNEREIDGTNVIEIEISPINDMQVYMDCVGILKLRNADVEKRIGPAKAKTKKKNSTKARLVFRCTLRKPDGGVVTLQVASTPILCTQPIGQPEISRLSLSELCVNQTNDLFIIGKNFLKGTQIFFREVGADETDTKWQSEAEIEVEYFQQTHLICRIPEYPNKDIKQPVHCQIVAFCAGKVSDPQDFMFKPAMVMVKVENEMETEPSGPPRSLPFSVSPVALHLNRLVERTQTLPSSTAMFQLPPGAIPSICTAPTLPTPPRVVSSTPTQPLPSILKPATLCLPASGQTLTLGGSAPAGDGKGPVPVQFVLPTPGVGSGAVAVDSRQLGNQPTQLVLMPTPPTSTQGGGNGGGGAVNSKQPPVLTFTSVASASASTPPLNIGGAVNSQSGSRTSSAPMILFLAGPPATAVASSTAVTNTTAVPMSLQQSISNGQVESLLKQMLESSKSSSS